MIFKVEIDPFTKSGKKVYEYIESLKDKNGIRYMDFNEEDYLTEKELEKIEKRCINEMVKEYKQKKDSKRKLPANTKRKINKISTKHSQNTFII